MERDSSEQLIHVPMNPFWKIAKRFGRDELIALFINVIGTAIIAFFTMNPLVLAFAGPVIEKFGFFPAHFAEANNVYKTTSRDKRKNLSFYYKKAIRGSLLSLGEDILVHDPIYIVLMFFGIRLYTGTPAWMLSLTSFIVAIFCVMVLEYAVTELRYVLFRKGLMKKGFKRETYYEARFFIRNNYDPKKIAKDLSVKFDLTQKKVLDYRDVYYNNKMPWFSGRQPKLRLRRRGGDSPEDDLKSIQISYTRAGEMRADKFDQYRYFLVKKDKLYFPLSYDPGRIENIKEKRIQRLIRPYVDGKTPSKIVSCKRDVIENDNVWVVIDKVGKNDDFFLVEVKAKKPSKEYFQILRMMMREYPAVHTTHGKSEI